MTIPKESCTQQEEDWTTWLPDIGTQVVLVYPPDWDKPDLYGEVVTHDDDEVSYYLFTAILGQRRFIEVSNLIEHGAHIRLLEVKEKYPLPKEYLSPDEKKKLREKKKARYC